MAPSYTDNSGIEKPVEGEQTGTWGDTVNLNMDIIDRSLTGVGSIALSGTTHTLTTTDGTLTDGQYRVLVLGGTPSGTNTITISPSDQTKLYFVANNSGQSAVFTQGSGGNVTVADGTYKIIYADGAGAGAAVVDFTDKLAASNIDINGGTIDGTVIGGSSAAAGTFTTAIVSGSSSSDLVRITQTGTGNALVVEDSANPDSTPFVVNASGNVGIGTSSPDTKLNVVQSSTGRAWTPIAGVSDLLVERNGNAGISIIGAAASNSTLSFGDVNDENAGFIQYEHANDALTFRTGGAGEDMRITSSGNVGIGTASPAEKLDVYGDIKFGAAGPGQIYTQDTSRGSIQISAPNYLTTRAVSYGNNYYIDTAGTYQQSSVVIGGTAIEMTAANGDYGAFRFLQKQDPDSGGAERVAMVINSSGNVGIGTSSPSVTLHVSSGASDEVARFEGTGSPYITLYDTGVRQSYWYASSSIIFRTENAKDLDMGTSNSNAFIFRTNSAERMRIDSSGNVGIGTTSPDGNLNVQRTSASAGWIINGQTVGVANDSGLYMDASNNIELAVRNGSGTLTGAVRSSGVTFFNGGNVGIGTSSPSSTLHVSGGAGSTIRNTASSGSSWFVGTNVDSYVLHNESNTPMTFTTNGTERMRINSSGYVGIGITAPLTPLHVKGNWVNGEGILQIDANSGQTYSGLTIQNNGTVKAYLYHENTGDDVWLATSSTAQDLIFASSATSNERMRIQGSSGNVGIGTTSPSTLLHVVGNTIKQEKTTGDNNAFLGYVGSTNNSYIRVQNTAGYADFTANNGAATFNNSQAVTIFNTSSTERMRIDGSGNVGIGTTAPATKVQINSAGSTYTDPSNNNLPTLYLRNTNNASTTAHSILTLRTAGSAGGDPFIAFDIAGEYGYSLGIDNSDSNKFKISAAWSDLASNTRLTIDTSGNVGIGTTSPAEKLGIAPDTDVSAEIGKAHVGAVGHADYAGFSHVDQNSVGGYALLQAAGGTTHINTPTGQSIRFRINNVDKMVMDNAGNFGIGTTSPAKKLHVAGSALATIGTLTDGATITPNFDTNQNFSVTLGGNRTLANPTNIDAGQVGSIFVTQDGTGSRTLSFGAYWKFPGGTAPTLSTTAGAVDRIDYIVFSATAIHAVATLNVS